MSMQGYHLGFEERKAEALERIAGALEKIADQGKLATCRCVDSRGSFVKDGRRICMNCRGVV